MRHDALGTLAAAQRRIVTILTLVMIAIYFGFIALIAFAKPLLATPLVPGLTLGILLGVLVIVASWLLTWFYVWWANAHYDPHLDRLRK